MLYGMLLSIVGLALGLAGAFAVTRLMKTLLFAVSATDQLTFTGVAMQLSDGGVARLLHFGAGATRVDPMIALRAE